MPDVDEDYAAFKAWITGQGLELQQWHMDADIEGRHPYEDGECHCWGLKLQIWHQQLTLAGRY